MDKKKALINGTDIAYIDEGNGKTVVLLHGFCGSSMYWQKVIPQLARNYRIIAPDLRGHGDSSVPAGTYSMVDIADDISGLLHKLQIAKAALMGHSLGGYATLAFAEKHPDRLEAFGLVHSTALPDDAKGKEGRDKSIESIQQSGIEPFLLQLVPKLFAPSNLTKMREAVGIAESIGLQTDPSGAISTLKGMRDRPDRNDVLAASQVPVLLVAGTDDQVIPPGKTFSQQAPHIQIQELEQVGHMSMLEAPDQLTDVLRRFLQQVQKQQ